MLNSILPILQFLYWPAWYAGIVICGFTALLTLYHGLTTFSRRGRSAPAPESKVVALLGWLGTLCLAITLGPVLPYVAFHPVAGLTDFVRDEFGRANGLSILDGTRIIAGDNQSYWRFYGECVLILMLGGRGLCFAIMLWPERRPAAHPVLAAVLGAPTPRYDKTNGSRPQPKGK